MQRGTMYNIVRIVLAGVLLLAAGLKGYQLATEPALNATVLDAPWFLIAVVEFELLFGLWLLGNIWPEWTRRAAILCFAVFAAVSLYKALSGAASCGCLGRVAVNPWYTFTMDVAAVLALFWWRPSGAGASTGRLRWPPVWRIAAVVVAWLLVGVPGALMMGTYQHGLSTEEGMVLAQNDLVVLEAEKWTGKRLPLLRYIEDAPSKLKPGGGDLRQRL
ncbi:MAG: MauE/DoxX family redox-associated membrane protein, partial [Planctomycetota bacterium]